MKRFFTILWIFMACFASQSSQAKQDKPLRVAVVIGEPFAVKTDDAIFGLAVDIWKEIALRNLWEYEIFEHDSNEYDEVISKLVKNEYDVLIGPTTMSPERELKIDFSHPFYLDYITAIVKTSILYSFFQLAETFLYSTGFLLFILLSLFLVHTHLVWFFERHKNTGIPNGYLDGMQFVFWAHLTRQHYIGDPVKNVAFPETLMVRTSLLVWIMFAYLLSTLISGTVVSFMTVSLSDAKLGIKNPSELSNTVVGAINETYNYHLGQSMGLRMKPLSNFDEGLYQLDEGIIGAFLVDHSIASFKLQKSLNTTLRISPLILRYNLYSFAFPEGSKLKAKVDDTLAFLQESGTIVRICKEYIPNSKRNCEL